MRTKVTKNHIFLTGFIVMSLVGVIFATLGAYEMTNDIMQDPEQHFNEPLTITLAKITAILESICFIIYSWYYKLDKKYLGFMLLIFLGICFVAVLKLRAIMVSDQISMEKS